MNRKPRTFLSGIMVVIAIFLNAATAYSMNIYVDSMRLELDVPPTIIGGRTMVPVRPIFEAFDIEPEWNAEKQKVNAQKDDISIELIIGSRFATANKKTVALDSPAVIIDGRALVPLRFVSEYLGADVNWDSDTGDVHITISKEVVKTKKNDDKSEQSVESDRKRVIDIASAPYSTYAILDDGTVWGWGMLIGDGTTTVQRRVNNFTYNGYDPYRYIPVKMEGLNYVEKLSAGVANIAYSQDGSIKAWGSYKTIDPKQAPYYIVTDEYDWNNGGNMLAAPIEIDFLNDFIDVSFGLYHAIGLKDDGTVWAWGRNGGVNGFGQIGDGTFQDRDRPVLVEGISNVVSISAGNGHSVALKADGTVWSWGYNGTGTLGDGTVTLAPNYGKPTPVKAKGLNDVVSIFAGHATTFAIKNDGTVWAWGSNQNGKLGDGTEENRSTPTQVKSLNNVRQISTSSQYNAALKHDGTVWTWGLNFRGVLGDGTLEARHIPEIVNGLNNIVKISTGIKTMYALDDSGNIWTWGSNMNGILGAGINAGRTESSPVKVAFQELELGDNGYGEKNGYQYPEELPKGLELYFDVNPDHETLLVFHISDANESIDTISEILLSKMEDQKLIDDALTFAESLVSTNKPVSYDYFISDDYYINVMRVLPSEKIFLSVEDRMK